MSLKSTIEFYKQAKYLHKQISDIFDQFETGNIAEEQKDTIISRTIDDINKLNGVLNKINLHDLEGSYKQEIIDDVEHNVDFYYEAADYIEKYLLGKQYYSALLHGVNSLIKKMAPFSAEYDKYATSEYELSKKFTNMMLHPNNINQFKNQIKRMSLGTMSLNEFRKIYSTNKGRMPKLSNTNKFKSFKEYKDENHETQN